jgi:hypothetical protein
MLLTTYALYQASYPDSTLTETQFNALNPIVSTAIESYLDRNLAETVYEEYHDTHYDTILITKEWPVTKIYGIFCDWINYSQINIDEQDHLLTIQNNVSSKTIEFVVDLETEGSYDYSSAANVSSMANSLSTILAGNSISNTISENESYNDVSVKLIKEIQFDTLGRGGMVYILGPDLNSQLGFVLQGDRHLVLDRELASYSNRLYIKYKAGYTLSTLPHDIIDVANRLIKELSDYDNSGTSAYIKSETLGDASYSNQDGAISRSFPSGLLNIFADQLAPYVRYDIHPV